jgi:hypothetical protein
MPCGETLEERTGREQSDGGTERELRESHGNNPRNAGQREVQQHGEADGAANAEAEEHEELSDATHLTGRLVE